MAMRYTANHVIVDYLTKIVPNFPTRECIGYPDAAQIVVEHIIVIQSVPDNTTDNRGKEFNSRL